MATIYTVEGNTSGGSTLVANGDHNTRMMKL